MSSLDCGAKVAVEFVIGKVFRTNRALDQVNSWWWRWGKSVHRGPETASNTVTQHRIPDFSAYCVGHAHWRGFGMCNKHHSKWSAAAPPRWGRKLRKLPSGNHPTRHERIRPSAGGGPCHGGPSRWHDQRGCAYGHGNRASWRAYADLAGMYASRKPLLKLFFGRTAVPPGGRRCAAEWPSYTKISPVWKELVPRCMVTLPATLDGPKSSRLALWITSISACGKS